MSQPLALPAHRFHDVGDVRRTPPAETSDAQPGVEIRPFDYDANQRTTRRLGALEVPGQVTIQTRFYLDTVAGKTPAQMSCQKRLEVKRCEATRQVDGPAGCPFRDRSIQDFQGGY
jgi:hypothetical protein